MSATDRAVACIGVFDGVHRGHRALLARGRQEADRRGDRLVAVTFDPHPLSVVGPAGAPTSLATVPHRIALLGEAGADEVDVLAFDAALAATEPEDFVADLLVERLRVSAVVVGEDFRFGRRARGDVAMLRDLGAHAGFDTVPVGLVGEPGQRWSSTLVRGLLAEGDVAGAAEALARPYRLEGEVVHGDHRGRELGYPTANLGWSGTPTIPADGVYAGWLVDGAERWPAAVSVGTNPQFDGRERRVEAFVIDREGLDLYGHDVCLEFAARIRGQQTFADVSGLVARMAVDVDEARVVLAAHG